MSAPPKALAIIFTSYNKESTNKKVQIIVVINKIDLIIHKYIAGSLRSYLREKQILFKFSVHSRLDFPYILPKLRIKPKDILFGRFVALQSESRLGKMEIFQFRLRRLRHPV